MLHPDSAARSPRRFAAHTSLLALLGLVACSSTNPYTFAPHPAATASIQGNVHGGQQPVANAAIQLYTVGTSGDGSAATPLLLTTTQTDSNGNFGITGNYTCTGATDVYITATGGKPTPTVTNPALQMMTALGPCTSLLPTTFTTINEVTTVAAVAALAPFMTSATAIGASAADTPSLQAAFTTARQFADPAAGVSPGAGVPSGYTVPTALINTLADALAACVNSSGGTAGDGTACGTLFTAATRAGAPAPTTTVAALLNIISNSTANDPAIFSLVNAAAPFQPTLTAAPADFRPTLTPNSGSTSGELVSPSTVPFLDTPTGILSVPVTVTLTNNSGGLITFGPISIVGPNASDFVLTSSCGLKNKTGQSCTLTVAAQPTAIGARTAYLQVNSNSPDSPLYVPLSVNAVTPTTGTIQVSGNHLTRDGATYTPHGLNLIAFVQAPAAQPIGCDPMNPTSNNFQNAYNRQLTRGAATFTQLAAWGADSIRFQVSQIGLDNTAGNTLYSQGFFNNFVTAVQQARAAGLTTIVSIQDECQSGDPNTALEPNASTQHVWSELAPLFRGDLGIVFELYNEPEPTANTADWQAWQTAHNAVIATIRAAGATNVAIADGLQFATTLNGVLPLTDPVSQVALGIHPYFHMANFTNATFDANFGNAAATTPVVSTEWAAVANAAQSGSTYYCDTNTPSQSLLLFNYLQSHGIGMEGFTWDFTGQVFGSMVYFVNGTTTTYNTSRFTGLNCGDNGYGAGLTLQTWFQTNTVPAAPQ